MNLVRKRSHPSVTKTSESTCVMSNLMKVVEQFERKVPDSDISIVENKDKKLVLARKESKNDLAKIKKDLESNKDEEIVATDDDSVYVATKDSVC